ncbi:MAG: rRNA pseudouridine synthase [Bacteroidales bacterium]|nr:rRNA pseudouridine synthase [Bacteroidales bacterium]
MRTNQHNNSSRGRNRNFKRNSNSESTENNDRPQKRTSGPRVGKTNVFKSESNKPYKAKTYNKPFDNGKKKTYREEPGSGPVRLNKYIANSGICSRREADTYITAGVVKVNGKIITELGYKVNPYDKVEFEGQIIKNEAKVYVVLNKPKDTISAVTSDRGESTVVDIVSNCCNERIYPVGRLDKATTGVLLLTNDGDLTKKLTHPSKNIKKIYQVSLDKPLTKADMEKLAEGIVLEDGEIHADEISYIDLDNKAKVGVELHSGRNRIVRRMFEHLGYRVKKLDRVYFAGITKKNVPRGKWRFLSEKEIGFLKML